MQQDEEHLRLLSIFYYIAAGITGLFACFPVFHLTMGLVILFSPSALEDAGHRPMAAFGDDKQIIGTMFVVFASATIIVGWMFAAAMLLTGRALAKRSHWTFCIVVSAICCIIMPYGTALGVFSIIVLNRSTVRELFESSTPHAISSMDPQAPT